MNKKTPNHRKNKKPWPTKDVMEQIYNTNLWGGEASQFYSGDGSHKPIFVIPYVKALINFFTSFGTPLEVCDLGCGDFNVGKDLFEHTSKYIAVDVVKELIERNKKLFEAENLEFHCLDIAIDEWPSGDCILLRQVLQHLSNKEIGTIVPKLYAYKYVILTEHLPTAEFIPNVDILTGQGIRLKKKSGVDLQANPFNLRVKKASEVLSLPYGEGKGRIVTMLFEM